MLEGEREAGEWWWVGRMREERNEWGERLVPWWVEVRPAMAKEISASCFNPEKSWRGGGGVGDGGEGGR